MASEPAGQRPMHIGEVAERAGLSLRTLRHYDEVGLLQPSGRSEGGFRLYTEDDLAKVLVIRRMKPLGFSLPEMLEVMELIEVLRAQPPRQDLQKKLSEIIDQATERRAALTRQLAMADEFIDLLTRYLR